ncbi:hypothetical protein F5Y16DRAFT_344590 [Xylariaceae sp. FL0255]|nr:hypothetical protein F5Y16DRAFT_344590 [Xylariaceae sp. FL0255]
MDTNHNLEEFPPPYTADAADAASLAPPYEISPDFISSQLQEHLSLLPSRIRSTQQAQSAIQSLDDAASLDALLPEVEIFLARLGNLHPTPKLAHLTLVPDVAVPSNASLSSIEEMRRRGELCQVARVSVGETSKGENPKVSPDQLGVLSGESSWSVGREFSDWGRFGDSDNSTSEAYAARNLLWWKDENMARRLARYLQPPAPPKEPPPAQNESPALVTSVQAVVEQRLPPQKERRGWFGSRKASSSQATAPVPSKISSNIDKPIVTQPETRSKQPERTKIVVTAEEVAFRRENDFGIIESMSGWAVVVALRVKP